MNSSKTKCPNCDSENLLNKGKLFNADYFSGVKQNCTLEGGWLYECKTCKLGFRYPVIREEEILTRYQNGLNDLYHTEPATRKDWFIAGRWIEQNIPENGSVLDIGCFDGAFLNKLGETYQKYGIEIHPAAIKSAKSKNIKILHTNLYEIKKIDGYFDCITLVDVIEHVTNPGSILHACLSKLKKDGILIITTGNYDAWQFRLMAPNYWYCNIEHIIFIGEQWLKEFFKKREIKSAEFIRFSHRDASILGAMMDFVKNIAYLISPSLFLKAKRIIRNQDAIKEQPASPPDWKTAKDHIAILVKK